ncbi:MAG: translocation/assembly module TamB domain-containing protein [Cyanobacteria bacterium J06638_28]
MTHTPSEEQTPQEGHRRRRIWATTGLTVGAIATLGIAGGVWWAWVFVNERLSPWVSEFLTESLNRPVALGEVERVSLTSIRFGPSAVPPTEADSDELYIEAINVRFNLLQLLGRKISPRINLIGLRGYFEQNEDGQWLETELDLPEADVEEEPLIQVDPTIGIADSEVILLPYLGAEASPLPLTIGNISGSVGLTKVESEDPRNPEGILDAQEINLDLTADPEDAGNLTITGVLQRLDYGEAVDETPLDQSDGNLANLQGNLAVQAQQLDLAILAPSLLASLPQTLPVAINAGTVDSSLEIELDTQAPPRVTGTARLDDGEVAVAALPQAIEDISAQLRFQGDRVALEEGTANYANLQAKAEGLIDTRNGYDLQAEIAPFEIAELAEELELDLPVEASGEFRAEATVTGPLNNPEIDGQLLSTNLVTVDRVQLARIATEWRYTPAALILSSLLVEPLAGGRLTGSGEYTLTDPALLSLQLEGRDLPADAIASAYGLPEDITLGAVALDADISGPLDDLSGLVSWQAPGGTFPTRGTAEIIASTVFVREAIVEAAGGTIAGSGTIALNEGVWDADVNAQGIQLGVFDEALQGATGGGNLRLAGNFDDLSLRGIQADGDVTASLQGGTVDGQIALANGNWNADVQTRNFPISQFATGLPVSSVSANARLAGDIDNLTLPGIRGNGDVTVAIAGGTVTSNFALRDGAWQADNGRVNGVQLGQLATDLQGTADGTFQLAGSLEDLSPNRIRGRANVTLSDGLATAAALSPQLATATAPLTASVAWDGRQITVDPLETEGLFARGTITPVLSGPEAPGIAAIDLDVEAQDYALAALPVSFPPAVGIAGTASLSGRLTGTPDNLSFLGTGELANLALNDLVFEPLLAGDINFSSQDGLRVALIGEQGRDEIIVTYTPDPMDLDFRIQAGEAIATGETDGEFLTAEVRDFPISALNLPPSNAAPFGPLRGDIKFATANVNLQDFRTEGQINIENLGMGYLSVDRLFGRIAYVDGVASFNNGQIRMIDVAEDGVEIVRTYDLSGRYSFDSTPQIQAALSTEEGQLRDILEILKIQNLADLGRGFAPEEGFIPSSQEEAEALLATVPAGDPNGTLLNQLRRLSEILEIELQEDIQTETALLPPLEELEGAFAGEVRLSATLPEDIVFEFDLDGDDWRWGQNLQVGAVKAQGTYQNGLVFLEPIRLGELQGDPNAYVEVTGNFDIDPEDRRSRDISLTIVDVPIEQFSELANLPLNLGGKLNGTAMLSGQLADPTFIGNLQIDNGTLNRRPIEQFTADVEYIGARASLDANLQLVDVPTPLTLVAEAPYRFPFVERSPIRNDFFVEANVVDEGFALLNLLTNQVTWQEVQGEARFRLDGTWYEAVNLFLPSNIDGSVRLRDATVELSALPEPLTAVQGEILLDDQEFALIVNDVTGNFSEGRVMARGTFPILGSNQIQTSNVDDSEPGSDDSAATPVDEVPPDEVEEFPTPELPITEIPLSVSLDDIALNLKGLYNGQVNGQIIVGGALLESFSPFQLLGPELTGAIDLSNGVITIPEGRDSPPPESAVPVRFNNLELVLNDDIQIVQGVYLDVEGTGNLALNGTLTSLRPEGVVRLPSGRVGLFGVALRLSGEDDRAEFEPELAFDPLLDVTLEASIPDTSVGPGLEATTSPFPRNEVPDTTIENIGLTQQGNRLVSVTARYAGLASDLSDFDAIRRNLDLTSSPLRSENEIIALLSGNVVGAINALGTQGSSAGGLATFAGSALFSTIRDFVGNTGPINDFRIFQVTESSGEVNESQDIGAEIGFDVTSNISVSVLKVLTNDTPFQFNTRYRISNQFNLRGTTSFEEFQDRTGVLLEYESRF